MNNFINNSWVIWLTLFFGLFLQIISFPSAIYFLKPHWLMLVFVFWIINILEKVQLTRPFIIGAIYDLFSGTVFGVHAFVFTFIAYIVSIKAQVIKNLALWQQALIIFFLSLLYNVILFVIQLFLYQMVILSPLVFLSAFTDGLAWILVFFVLKFLQMAFDVN